MAPDPHEPVDEADLERIRHRYGKRTTPKAEALEHLAELRAALAQGGGVKHVDDLPEVPGEREGWDGGPF